MSIQNMYRQTASTEREQYVGSSTIKKEYVSHLASFPCHVQPQDPSNASGLPGSFGKYWVLFCGVCDIGESDKITVEGVAYRVAGIERFDFGINAHLEVTIRAFKD
jgi:hypothetical protein